MTIKHKEMYVKELVKTEKDKDDGVDITYKANLEDIEGDVKITITSPEPIDLTQGEKGLTVEIKTSQTKLVN